jgi:hypothetical protein
VVCRNLWEKLPAGAEEINKADIQTVGDVNQALADYYADSVSNIAEETSVSERAIRKWFNKELISGQGIRSQVLQGVNTSQGLDNKAISKLVDSHLIRKEERRGAIWFELAHDRLIEPVQKIIHYG